MFGAESTPKTTAKPPNDKGGWRHDKLKLSPKDAVKHEAGDELPSDSIG